MLQAGPHRSNEPSGAVLGCGLTDAAGGSCEHVHEVSAFWHENQPGFQVIRSYSIAVTRQDEIKLPDNIPVTRKTNKRLQATDIDGDNAEPRYQNFMREDNQELDAAYVNPIASDYFNCRTFLRPANEKEEDSCSYQNVVIGTSNSAESDDVDDYENSASIKIWKQSNISESPDDYPDYVNSDVAAVPN
ncbi:linker for activation of T-cells family member 2 isoform X2 [Trachemys scripta elegans]|uniref:linker for activation of T-cells family member 2 isoform X2 n=1 Tax=Trachemys scripta elegans TaxID=31138 RepID=UPI001555C7DE|nr:linker for activation of T-cells family member 2 isoform X2 [Trachemys scripta elegans]